MSLGLDPLYVVAVSQQEVFTDKDTGEVLASGEIRFFKDDERNVPKDVFILTGGPSYSYTNIGSVVSINAAGSPEYMGNNVNIYYFPYDENGLIERYYVQVVDSAGTEQFTREAKPNVFGSSSGGDIGDSAFVNYISNGQFVSNIDLPNSGLISEDITTIALGGWTFNRPSGTDAIDNVTFSRFNSYLENPEAHPRYAVKVVNSGGGEGDLFKDLRVRFDDVNKFGSDDQEYTFKFSARSLIGDLEDVDFVLIKNYGTGGSSQTETSIESFNISGTYTSHLATFTFGDNASQTIGPNDDDYLELAIRLPSNIVFNVDLTNFTLVKGNFSEVNFPDTSTRQSISQSLGGAFPNPNPDGSDLYLTPRLTPSGWEYDTSEIGRVIAKSIPTVEVGELLADGTSYFTNQKSADGIPYSRLQAKYFDASTQTMLYGTGIDNMTAYVPGISGIASIMIVSNLSGVAANAADGAISTGFTFDDSYIATGTSHGLNAWVENDGVSYSQETSNGNLSAPTPGTAGVTISVSAIGTVSTPLEFSVTYPTGASLANGGSPGKYWTYDTLGSVFYVWYQTSAETDPVVPGRIGIKVLVSTNDTPQQVAEKTVSALCNCSASAISTIQASSMTAGSYFTVSVPSENFYVWYTIDGVGTDPSVGGATGIQVDLLNSDGAIEVESKTQLAINTRKFAVPDYRGMFLRGSLFTRTDIGLGNLDSRFSRTNFKNPIIANGRIGSEELSINRSHTHGTNSSAISTSSSPATASTTTTIINNPFVSDVFAGPSPQPGTSYYDIQPPGSFGPGLLTWSKLRNNISASSSTSVNVNTTTNTSVSTTVLEDGSTESRPANAYVTYVIKY